MVPRQPKGHGKPARGRSDDEAMKAAGALIGFASVLGIFASIVVLDRSYRWIHDVPRLAATARAIPLLRPATVSGISWALVAGLFAGYAMAGLLIFLLTREGSKRPEADL